MEEFDDSQLLDGYDDELKDENGVSVDDDVKILTSMEVGEMLLKTVEDLSDIFKLSRKDIRCLLNKYNWNEDKLMEEALSEGQKEPDSKIEDLIPSQTDQCNICFTVLLQDQINSASLSCRHSYHRSCWNHYLTIKIMDEGRGDNIECPGCEVLVDDDFVMDLIDDNNVRNRYWSLVTNSFVEHHRQLRWCPGKGCDRAVWMEVPSSRPILCSCGLSTCFKCGREAHSFIPCTLMESWDSLMEQVPQGKKKEVKGCPGCRVLIEKNGGCNRMVCSQCGTKFSWSKIDNEESSESGETVNQQVVKRKSGLRRSCRLIFGKIRDWWGAHKCDGEKQEEPNKTFIIERIEDTKFEASRMKWETYFRSLGKAVLIDPKFINPQTVETQYKETKGKNLHPFFILGDLKSKLQTYASFDTEPIFGAIKIVCASQSALMDMEILAYFLADLHGQVIEDAKHLIMMLFVELEEAVHNLSLTLMNLEKDISGTDFNSHRLAIMTNSGFCQKKLNSLLMMGRELLENNTLVFRKKANM